MRVGVIRDDSILDLAIAAPELPADMISLLAAGPDALAAIRQVPRTAAWQLLETVRLEAPIARPPKLLAIGLNYRDHVAESASVMNQPKHQLWFNKQSTCVIGPGTPIHRPRVSQFLDYEGELAFVIGRRCRHVPAEKAAHVIAGYTVMNDVSVRDWQLRTPTMTMGKSFDTHGPMGPWIVTSDELPDPHGLRLRTWVNGHLRQDANTDQMLFDCWQMVEHLSTAFTLEPGDVISTGTPAGVGGAMDPPQFLVAGDVVRIEIESIGVLENSVIDEPELPNGVR